MVVYYVLSFWGLQTSLRERMLSPPSALWFKDYFPCHPYLRHCKFKSKYTNGTWGTLDRMFQIQLSTVHLDCVQQSTARGSKSTHHLFLKIKLYWNTALFTHSILSMFAFALRRWSWIAALDQTVHKAENIYYADPWLDSDVSPSHFFPEQGSVRTEWVRSAPSLCTSLV